MKGRWGFIDPTGRLVIPALYETVHGYSDDVAPVQLNDKWGFIDKVGTTILPFRYDMVTSFNAGVPRKEVGRDAGSL